MGTRPSTSDTFFCEVNRRAVLMVKRGLDQESKVEEYESCPVLSRTLCIYLGTPRVCSTVIYLNKTSLL